MVNIFSLEVKVVISMYEFHGAMATQNSKTGVGLG